MPEATHVDLAAPTGAASDLTQDVGAAMADDYQNPPARAVSGLVDDQVAALARLREPMPDHLLAQKPVDVKNATGEKRNCGVCGGYHKPSPHLTYAGHAAITERLLDVDPAWSWEPVTEPELLAVLPRDEGGMWIRLTVAGVTRLGYGDAQDKRGHNAVKETIGDALRNAAMRFGVGLELWHKGELHADKEAAEREAAEDAERAAKMETAQATANRAAAAESPEEVAELAELAKADGLDEIWINDPDGNAGKLVAYLRHRHGQLVRQPNPVQETADERDQAEADALGAVAKGDEAQAEQDALDVARDEQAAINAEADRGGSV